MRQVDLTLSLIDPREDNEGMEVITVDGAAEPQHIVEGLILGVPLLTSALPPGDGFQGQRIWP